VKLSFENSFPEGFDLKTNIDRTFKDNKESVSVVFEPTFAFCNNFKLKSKILARPEKEVSLEAKNLLTPGTVFLKLDQLKNQNLTLVLLVFLIVKSTSMLN